MKKSYTGKEGPPPGRVNFSEGLYEKKTLIPLLELGALIVNSRARPCLSLVVSP